MTTPTPPTPDATIPPALWPAYERLCAAVARLLAEAWETAQTEQTTEEAHSA
jgi:hypothetical protein